MRTGTMTRLLMKMSTTIQAVQSYVHSRLVVAREYLGIAVVAGAFWAGMVLL